MEFSSLQQNDSTWRMVEQWLDETEQCAVKCPTREDFYQVLVDRMSLALGAASSQAWILAGEQVELVAKYEDATLSASAQDVINRLNHSAQLRVAQSLETNIADLEFTSQHDNMKLASAVVRLEEQRISVVQLLIPRPADATARENVLRILAAFEAVTEDYHRRLAINQLKLDAQLTSHVLSFVKRIHDTLELQTVAYEIANEARVLLDVDRVSVLRFDRGKCQTLAISNLAVVDRRNRTIAALEDLATGAAATLTTVWHGVGRSTAPELDDLLQTYVDTSHSRVVGVVPMLGVRTPNETTSPRVCGAIVVESFTADVTESLRRRAQLVAEQAAAAFANAVTHSTMPLRSAVRLAGQLRAMVSQDQLPKTLVWMAAIAACIAALIFVPANFTIEAEGQLQPASLRNIYAPFDADITAIRVRHDDTVEEGQELLVLRSAELDLQYRRVAGERAATEERLLAAESDRITTRSADGQQRSAMIATEEELRHRLGSLDEQLRILESQRDALLVTSPIQGHVLTWEPQEVLAARPVRRGQLLLSVADMAGEWHLTLQVADDASGYVLDAMSESSDPLPVEFALATEPGVIYSGEIKQMARITTLDQRGRSVVEVIVQVQDGAIRELRPGAATIANIYCGRKSLGFVWLRDVVEFVQAKVLF